ncbi:MAG: biotin-dependent carboxyltransferase family protein, partial [Oscillospiraceae bacterium]|nr:biotin-dependent carboxyltransferase family protein [Oscillospiraceae bacterium]
MKVIKSGLQTSVQDLGRYNYQMFGVSPGGPMDKRSFLVANVLVGNEENAAALEMTMMGPTLEFEEATVFAVTGGDFSPRLNGTPIESYRAVAAKPGDKLSFGMLKTGCRGYIAFAGGIDVPEVLGSRSTLIRAQFGGHEGRPLKAGDRLKLMKETDTLPCMENRFTQPENFSAKENTLRVVLGPQDYRFTEKGLATFLGTPYKVGMEFDRMGYRLAGEKIEHVTDANIPSDGIAFGSVQVPGNGFPIIMAAERQPMGGYTKIANVISVDMPLLGQMKTGDTIHFEKVTMEQAQDLYLAERAMLEELRKKCLTPAPAAPMPSVLAPPAPALRPGQAVA